MNSLSNWNKWINSGNSFRAWPLAVLCSLLLPIKGYCAPYAWVADSMRRVAQDERPPSRPGIERLSAARGEYAAFQIVVTARDEPLTNVTVAAEGLKSAHGSIPANAMTLYGEHYVRIKVSHAAGKSNAPLPIGLFPDALIPFLNPATGKSLSGAKYDAIPFRLDKDRSQPIWIDLQVPRYATPGKYTGNILVRSNQGAVTVPIELMVWHFELPLRPSLRSSIGVWEQKGAFEELLKNRLMPNGLPPNSIKRLDDQYGLNAISIGEWSGASIKTKTARTAPPASLFEQREQAVPANLRKYLYNYTADEISDVPELIEPMKQWARNIHTKSGVKNMVVMVPDPALFDDGSGQPAVDIWVVLPDQSDDKRDSGLIRQAQQKGCEVWTYNTQCLDDYSPKWDTNYTPINWRIQPWINQVYGFNGLLYWRADLFFPNMWEETDPGGWPGDGQLLYPGEEAGLPGDVVPSMRLKYLRQGVEDYEYIALLKSLGESDYAMKIVKSVARDWRHWTKNPDELSRARLALGKRIDEITIVRGRGKKTRM